MNEGVRMSITGLSSIFSGCKIAYPLPKPVFTCGMDTAGKLFADLSWERIKATQAEFKAAHSDPEWVYNRMCGRFNQFSRHDEYMLDQWNNFFFETEVVKRKILSPHNKVFAVAVFDASLTLGCMRNKMALTPIQQ